MAPVLWYHLVLSAYGHWLPNDPRGSWSTYVGSRKLYAFGGATKVSGKRSYAHDPHDRERRLAAKAALNHPPVRFDGEQRDAIAAGFAHAVAEGSYTIHAACVGFDHVHLVVARHERSIEMIARHLKSKATMELTRRGVHPLATRRDSSNTIPTPWAAKCWSVFISDESQLQAALRYVERHPEKEGLTPQHYLFVVPLEDRLALRSHNDRSPL